MFEEDLRGLFASDSHDVGVIMAIVFSSKITGDTADMYSANNYYTGMYALAGSLSAECEPQLTPDLRLRPVLGRNGSWAM